MADVVLKARDGTDVTYPGVEKVRLLLADGSTKDFEDKDASGTGSINTEKPIRFYDPYGEVLYAYSRAEIQELEELPTGPGLSGLTFEGWTHTLDELKAVTYFADVGPMYKYGSSPATVLIVETRLADTSVTVTLDMWSSSYKCTVYWGDGTNSSLTGTSSASSGSYRRAVSHTYSSIGEYNIAIVCTSGLYNLGSYGNTYAYSVMDCQYRIAYASDAYLTYTDGTDFYLKSILIGSHKSSSSYPSAEAIAFSARLQFVSMGANTGRYHVSNKIFAFCPGLKVIAGKGYFAGYQYILFSNVAMRRVKADLANYDNMLSGCDSLEEVEYYSNTKIVVPKMNVQWAMLMNSETPPTISATTPVWGTKPIYVPDAAVDTYKAADGWSSAADYILPASEYPDE